LLYVKIIFEETFDDSFFVWIIINFTCDPLIFIFLYYLDEAAFDDVDV
jgi:hypothetical protein